MQPNPNSAIVNLIPLIFIFGVFYFLLIRPQQKKQRELKEMIKNLNKNDEVVTVGGVHGTIVNVKERTFIIRIDDNTKIEIDRSAVSYLKKQQGS